MNRYGLAQGPFFVLAPMDDVTDTVFRQVVGACAPPDLYFTEFVNVDGLQSPGRSNLFKKIRFSATDQPLIVQIWGKNPDNYYKTAQQLVDGTFVQELGLPVGTTIAGIDINMGCPEKTVVKNGCGSALICDRPRAEQVIAATKAGAAGAVPVSVKTRLGFNGVDLGWSDWLLDQNLDMLTIHGRTRKQMSLVSADWDLIGQVRRMRDDKELNTLIVGNGDVQNRQHGLELAQRYRLDGIMIGRGIFADPFAFAVTSPWSAYTRQQKIALYIRHVQLFADTWQLGERPVHTLNRFCKVYINGFDGAKELREHLMRGRSTDELRQLLQAAAAE